MDRNRPSLNTAVPHINMWRGYKNEKEKKKHGYFSDWRFSHVPIHVCMNEHTHFPQLVELEKVQFIKNCKGERL